jgi:hypothetical protein
VVMQAGNAGTMPSAPSAQSLTTVAGVSFRGVA